ncbi:MAG: hypothetical protein QOF29_3790 [bacterium]
MPADPPGAVAGRGSARGSVVAALVAGARRLSRRRPGATASCLVVLAAVGALTAPPAAAAPRTDRLARSLPTLRTALDRLVAAGAPGAVVLVRDGGRTVRQLLNHTSGLFDYTNDRAC